MGANVAVGRVSCDLAENLGAWQSLRPSSKTAHGDLNRSRHGRWPLPPQPPADGPGDGTVAESPPEHERHQTPEYEHDAPLQGRGQRDGVDYGGACDHPALNSLRQ